MLLVNIVFFKKQIKFLEEARFDIKKKLDDTKKNSRFSTMIIRPKIVCCV